MPNATINALTAPDGYTQASTLDPGTFISHFNIDVANQAIYWQAKEAPSNQPAGAGYWIAEVFMAPGSRTITRGQLCGVRFRAAIPAANLPGLLQAVVTVEAAY